MPRVHLGASRHKTTRRPLCSRYEIISEVAALFVGGGGSVSGRIRCANDYLANSDEALSASMALMARAIGITPSTLEEVLSAKTAQEEPLGSEEYNWMEGFDDD